MVNIAEPKAISLHRYAFGRVACAIDFREVLVSLGLIVGGYNESDRSFYVCGDLAHLDLFSAAKDGVDLSGLLIRDELRLLSDDYPATRLECETEIAWCEFMLHPPVGKVVFGAPVEAGWRRRRERPEDIATRLAKLNRDLLAQFR